MSAWDQIMIVEADITELEVDAIVNAANTSLLGGSGVDGAIHRAAGRELLAECQKLDGPRWSGGDKGERGKLASCYRRCMELVKIHELTSIAFPGISTGVYGYPLREAADTALATVHEYLDENPSSIRVTMCTYDSLATMIMTDAMKDLRFGP
jgi:O-acetyl-ADP-ribose deacetylase (regulator of RNase III)